MSRHPPLTKGLPVLWLCGPPGVGKTAVAWEVHRRLVASDVASAYVDVDQLGISYPEPFDDPARHRLKARSVVAVRRNFAAAGASLLIVSGVVDGQRGPDSDILGERPFVGRLRADAGELAARLGQRRGSSAVVDAAVHEAEVLDGSTFADWYVDTTELTVDDVVERVVALGRPALDGPASAGVRDLSRRSTTERAGGQLLWLTGVTGVGKSTVGFRAYLRVLSAGHPAAFVDVGQLGFFGQSPSHPLQAQNLASVWANYHAAGAKNLVVVGSAETHTDRELYERALRGVSVTWCRLHASPDELTRRLLSRQDGGSWPEPGDPLMGRSHAELLAVANRAIAHSEALDAGEVGLRVTVDGLSADEAATVALERAAWPLDGRT